MVLTDMASLAKRLPKPTYNIYINGDLLDKMSKALGKHKGLVW